MGDEKVSLFYCHRDRDHCASHVDDILCATTKYVGFQKECLR